MTRIGLVTGEFPPMEGGVGAFTQELARAMSAQGHEVHVITGRQARPDEPPPRLGQLREPVDLGFGRLHPVIRSWRWPALAQVVDVMIRYDLALINLQYQAAAYHMGSAAVNFLPWRVRGVAPCVVTFHDLRVPYLFPKAGAWRRRAVNFMARLASGSIVTNQADQDALQATVATPVRQIPIGSNIATYAPNHIELAEVRELLGVAGDACLLGYFGFLHESKGADTLVQALARLPDHVHLVFIGGQTGSSDAGNTAAFLARLRRQIADLALTGRVHWTGFQPAQRVSTYLQAVDLVVMPYRDGVSLRRGTLMAALAHGRPIITTHPLSPAPLLEHGANVWLVPPQDPAAVAEAVQRLWPDWQRRRQLGQAAAALAAEFSWDRIAARTLAFFDEILNA